MNKFLLLSTLTIVFINLNGSEFVAQINLLKDQANNEITNTRDQLITDLAAQREKNEADINKNYSSLFNKFKTDAEEYLIKLRENNFEKIKKVLTKKFGKLDKAAFDKNKDAIKAKLNKSLGKVKSKIEEKMREATKSILEFNKIKAQEMASTNKDAALAIHKKANEQNTWINQAVSKPASDVEAKYKGDIAIKFAKLVHDAAVKASKDIHDSSVSAAKYVHDAAVENAKATTSKNIASAKETSKQFAQDKAWLEEETQKLAKNFEDEAFI